MTRRKLIKHREAELLSAVSGRAGWNVAREGFVRPRMIAWLARHPPLRAEIRIDLAPPSFVGSMYIRQGGGQAALAVFSTYATHTQAASTGHIAERFSSAGDAVRAAEEWWRENCALRHCSEHMTQGE